MEEELHLLRQQALRTLPSPSKRAGTSSLGRHKQGSFQLESGFRIEELLFHEELSQLHQKEQLTAHKFAHDKILRQPESNRDSSLLWRKRSLQTRPLTHSKRQKRSTSDTSSHSAYSSSSQSHSSQSSYSSRSSSPSHSHRSRSSSYSSQSRSLSSHNSGSYSRSSFSSSSHSPPSDFKSRSKNPRHQHVKTRGVIDKRTSSSAKNLQSPPVVHSKSCRTDIKYRQKDEVMHRDRISLHSNKVMERSYRPHSRHSRSPPRLRDKFLEHNRHSSYSHDFHYHHRPPRSSSRERRTIDRRRRSPAVDSNYLRGRMRPSYSPLKVRHRTVYPPTRMQRRHHMHSLDRPRQLIGRGKSNRLSGSEHERKLGTVELCRRDESHNPKKTEMMNSNNVKPTSGADLQVVKSDREKRERKETMGRTERTENDLCKSDEFNSVRKEEDLARNNLEQSETQFEASDLLGEYEFSVELDYDENMEELDVHSIESPQAKDGLNDVSSTASVQEKVNVYQSGKTQSRSLSPESLKRDCLSVEENKGEERINSPICVSPHRDKSRRIRDDNKTPFDGKLSVKERLYVSRQTIEEKRKAAAKCESQSVLRPSLASRLGPSPHNRHRSDDYLRSRQSRLLSKSSKGDALAIAEAYRRKKRREAIGLHEDEVQKAKKFTEIINEHGSKNKGSPVLADFEDDGDREKALDKRINEIKEQNKAIMKRNREIEQDREMYG